MEVKEEIKGGISGFILSAWKQPSEVRNWNMDNEWTPASQIKWLACY